MNCPRYIDWRLLIPSVDQKLVLGHKVCAEWEDVLLLGVSYTVVFICETYFVLNKRY